MFVRKNLIMICRCGKKDSVKTVVAQSPINLTDLANVLKQNFGIPSNNWPIIF